MSLACPIPSRCLAIIAALLIPLTLAVVPAHAQLFGMSEKHEIQLGRRVEAQIEKRYGFDSDPQSNERVAGLGMRLAAVSERPNLPWTYHIVRDASVNAFAVPGGFVFVTQGLMSFVNSDDELAFVLAHETTHIAHRHAVDLAERDMELQVGFILLTQLLFPGSAIAYQISQITRGLVDARFSRDKELEADHYGLIYAQKAGFDPAASIPFFERLQQLEKEPNGLGRAFANHPPTPDRIKAVRAELRQLGYEVAGPVDPSPPPSPPSPSADLVAPADPVMPIPGQGGQK
jgi:predicted Zn-dependent protease